MTLTFFEVTLPAMRKLAKRLAGTLVVTLGLLKSGLAQPVEILPPSLHGAIQPQVAIAPNGNVFVVFGRDSTIYCATSTNGGRIFLAPREVARLPKLSLGMRRGPRIAVSGQHLVISAVLQPDGNLGAWTSEDAGFTWVKAATINSVPKSAREGLHAMTSDGLGNVHACWLDLRNRGTQLWSAVSRDGGRTWGENVKVYNSPDGHICECCHPSIIVLTNGVIRMMWRNSLKGARDMFTADSTDGGKTFSTAQKLGQGSWILNACPMDGGGLAGNYSIWRRDKSIFYTDDKSKEHLLGEGRQPVVGLGLQGPYFLWQKDSQLMLQQGAEAKPIVFAESGAYPVMANSMDRRTCIVTWEGMTNGVKTIYAEALK